MRRTLNSLILIAAFAQLSGCGGGTTINTKPLTEEEKAAIKIEDEKVRDEEGGNNKPVKPGKK